MTNLRSELDPIVFKRAWGTLDNTFTDNGLTLQRGYDFDLIDALAQKSGIKPLEAQFSTKMHSHTSGRSFWLGVFDTDGLLAGRVCARLDSLRSPESLVDFWRKHFHRCYPTETGAQVELAAKQPRFAQKITGETVYLGGTEVRSDWRGYDLGGLLNRVAQLEALADWDADFYYGWMERKAFKDGFFRACGFTKLYANSIHWQAGGPARLDNDLYLVANHRDDVLDMIDQVLAEPPKAASGSSAKTYEPLEVGDSIPSTTQY
ncbi:hypothetical protein [Roseibium alexandrii]|uniref:N-acetyltransferase domain-containing protein n=1 Tax=Roseibium alexandrii TaxID=388408 RepID=A0A0M6ZXP1_9HYPH|nr:hypothetical protein [Roseibium alexandrii]CTQ67548.1 hypothetical protein LAX5112_01427 [Roseibium alexandrii]